MSIRKNIGILVALVGLTTPAAMATPGAQQILDTLSISQIQLSRYLIDWKVGDRAQYQLSGAFGKMGDMSKYVLKDEGEDKVWVRQEASVMNRQEIIDLLLDRNSGEVLKMVRNGREQAPPKNDLEIISQDYATVTVPAGTFKALHIKANTKEVKNIEIWVNPSETVMDGALKQIMPTSLMTVTLELTAFEKAK